MVDDIQHDIEYRMQARKSECQQKTDRHQYRHRVLVGLGHHPANPELVVGVPERLKRFDRDH